MHIPFITQQTECKVESTATDALELLNKKRWSPQLVQTWFPNFWKQFVICYVPEARLLVSSVFVHPLLHIYFRLKTWKIWSLPFIHSWRRTDVETTHFLILQDLTCTFTKVHVAKEYFLNWPLQINQHARSLVTQH